ncbi:MAG: DUF2062 domain-containing protein [Gammaproteobacteria bacterium]|nr:DUF2062 domain-containing protein [Gammaproteobacteria bacterium]MCP5202453.1 DUF2062 domain-containing protein [Gammaproteobacteria bacterium]
MSPRHLLKRYLGGRERLAQSRAAGWLGARLHDPELWHLGRRSVAGGVGLGCFLAFIPLPVQMLIGTLLAFLMRVNLPVTMAAIWITNPLTMAPMFLFAFKIGAWITGRESHLTALAFEPSFSGVLATFEEVWLQLAVGCFVCGLSAAAIGNLAVRWLWRAHLLYKRRQRRLSGEFRRARRPRPK